jgi:hypothetical protein
MRSSKHQTERGDRVNKNHLGERHPERENKKDAAREKVMYWDI